MFYNPNFSKSLNKAYKKPYYKVLMARLEKKYIFQVLCCKKVPFPTKKKLEKNKLLVKIAGFHLK